MSIRNKESEIQNLKSEIRNTRMDKNSNRYDLEQRTFQFAKMIREFVRKLPKSTGNIEDGKQVVRSSGSIGANYIEANEALSRKDFLMRIKISRKEAKESRYWLRLIDTNDNEALDKKRNDLIIESTELMNIFGAIINKTKID